MGAGFVGASCTYIITNCYFITIAQFAKKKYFIIIIIKHTKTLILYYAAHLVRDQGFQQICFLVLEKSVVPTVNGNQCNIATRRMIGRARICKPVSLTALSGRRNNSITHW